MQEYSDLYLDSTNVRALYEETRGVEPSEYFWEEWNQAPDAVKQEIWRNLVSERNAQYAH